MLMEFPNLATTSLSLSEIFWLYASKDGSGASLADLLDLAVLLHRIKKNREIEYLNEYTPGS